MSTATAIPAVTLRARPATHEIGIVYCGWCAEPVTHDGVIWRHVRTGLPADWKDCQCQPVCDWPECHELATVSIGGDEWTGAGFRYRAKHFLCAVHRVTARRLGLGLIERT